MKALNLSRTMDGSVRKVISLFRVETKDHDLQDITEDLFLVAADVLRERSKDGVLPETWQHIVNNINKRSK